MENKKHCYEGMFLLDAGKGTFEVTVEPLQKILARSDVEVLMMKPWDELKLAYEIKDRKRGLYVLTYFKVDPAKVVEVEHDCQLSEDVLRVLLIRKDSISDEEIGADTPAELAEVQAAEAAAKAEVAAAEAAAKAEAAAAEAAEATAAEEATKAAEVDEAEVEKPEDEIAESLAETAAVVHETVVAEETVVVEEDAPKSEEKPADE